MVEDGTFDVIFAQVDSKIGDLSALTTTDKSSIVAGVNEVNADIGTLSSLSTTNKSNLVSAITEVDGKTASNSSKIGTMSDLTTTNKTNLVNAINEVKADNITSFAIATLVIQANEKDTTFSVDSPSGFTCHNSYIASAFVRDRLTWKQIYSDSSTSTGFKFDLQLVDHDSTHALIEGSFEFEQAVSEETQVDLVIVMKKFNYPY